MCLNPRLILIPELPLAWGLPLNATGIPMHGASRQPLGPLWSWLDEGVAGKPEDVVRQPGGCPAPRCDAEVGRAGWLNHRGAAQC